jgi:hypothetical protein
MRATIMPMTAIPPTTPPAMAPVPGPALVETAGVEAEVEIGIVVLDIDVVVVLEEVEVLED